MIRRPPRSTRTDTLFPYTTLFRSGISNALDPKFITATTPIIYDLFLILRPDTRSDPTLVAINLIGIPIAKIESIARSEEHTSELQSLMRISYAVFCLKKKKHNTKVQNQNNAKQSYLKHNTIQ